MDIELFNFIFRTLQDDRWPAQGQQIDRTITNFNFFVGYNTQLLK